MQRPFKIVLLFLLVFTPCRATEPQGKVLRETWYESRTEQGKLGYLHFQARQIERDGRKLTHTTIREELSYRRSGDPYSEKQEEYTLETETGEVVELGYSVNLSKKQQLALRGRVEGSELHLKVVDEKGPTAFGQKIAWDPAAVGLYAADNYFQGKSLKVGESLTIKAFHSAVNRVVSTTFSIQGFEDSSAGPAPKRLTRMEQSYPKSVYLSKSTVWLDEQGLTVKIQEDTPVFGVVTYERASKEAALAPFKARVADVESPITVNKSIKFKGGGPKELVVRVSMEGDDEPGTLFAQDGRQQVVKADKEKVELRLLARAQPTPAAALTNGGGGSEAGANGAGKEYLESNFFVRSDDERVKKLAQEAVGDEKDKRKQVQRIRRWIRSRFKGNYTVPFATADEVARTLEGDCSEMGILGAAMCRAVGIPSKVALGLVYDPGSPGFGGHLWTEVYIDGVWEVFDPTTVVPSLRAAYIKIADYSMKDVLNPDALIEVRRAFAGRMKVEIVD